MNKNYLSNQRAVFLGHRTLQCCFFDPFPPHFVQIHLSGLVLGRFSRKPRGCGQRAEHIYFKELAVVTVEAGKRQTCWGRLVGWRLRKAVCR